jgi:hypothetical protein
MAKTVGRMHEQTNKRSKMQLGWQQPEHILEQAGMAQHDGNYDTKRDILAGKAHNARVDTASAKSTSTNKIGGGGFIECMVRYDPIPLVHPSNRYLQWWQIMLLSMIGFNLLCVPYDLAFGVDSGGWLQWISYVSDCVFLLDIVITLHVKLCIEYHMDSFIVGRRDIIARQYLYGNFWVDVLVGQLNYYN